MVCASVILLLKMWRQLDLCGFLNSQIRQNWLNPGSVRVYILVAMLKVDRGLKGGVTKDL